MTLRPPENFNLVVSNLAILSKFAKLWQIFQLYILYKSRLCCGSYTLHTVNTVPTEPPITCPDLTVPANGMIDYSMGTRPVGTVATYTCNTGHTVNGDTTRTCGSDGVWSGSDPTCQGKEYTS